MNSNFNSTDANAILNNCQNLASNFRIDELRQYADTLGYPNVEKATKRELCQYLSLFIFQKFKNDWLLINKVYAGMSIVNLRLSPDKRFLISASADGGDEPEEYFPNEVQIWDYSGNLIHRLQGHPSIITKFDVSSDSQFIISQSLDGLIIGWRNFEEAFRLPVRRNMEPQLIGIIDEHIIIKYQNHFSIYNFNGQQLFNSDVYRTLRTVKITRDYIVVNDRNQFSILTQNGDVVVKSDSDPNRDISNIYIIDNTIVVNANNSLLFYDFQFNLIQQYQLYILDIQTSEYYPSYIFVTHLDRLDIYNSNGQLFTTITHDNFSYIITPNYLYIELEDHNVLIYDILGNYISSFSIPADHTLKYSEQLISYSDFEMNILERNGQIIQTIRDNIIEILMVNQYLYIADVDGQLTTYRRNIGHRVKSAVKR